MKIYFVEHEFQATEKVFIVEHEFLADVKAFEVDHDFLADVKAYRVDHEFQADRKVFLVAHEFLASGPTGGSGYVEGGATAGVAVGATTAGSGFLSSKKSKAPLVIGVLAVLGLGAGALAFFGSKSGDSGDSGGSSSGTASRPLGSATTVDRTGPVVSWKDSGGSSTSASSGPSAASADSSNGLAALPTTIPPTGRIFTREFVDEQGRSYSVRCPIPLTLSRDLPVMECQRGTPVLTIQQRLLDLGFSVDADGLYGPETEARVFEFQEQSGLVATGAVDRTSWMLLFSGVTLDGSDTDGDGLIEPGELS